MLSDGEPIDSQAHGQSETFDFKMPSLHSTGWKIKDTSYPYFQRLIRITVPVGVSLTPDYRYSNGFQLCDLIGKNKGNDSEESKVKRTPSSGSDMSRPGTGRKEKGKVNQQTFV